MSVELQLSSTSPNQTFQNIPPGERNLETVAMRCFQISQMSETGPKAAALVNSFVGGIHDEIVQSHLGLLKLSPDTSSTENSAMKGADSLMQKSLTDYTSKLKEQDKKIERKEKEIDQSKSDLERELVQALKRSANNPRRNGFDYEDHDDDYQPEEGGPDDPPLDQLDNESYYGYLPDDDDQPHGSDP